MRLRNDPRFAIQVALVVIALTCIVGYYTIEAADYARAAVIILRGVRKDLARAAETVKEEGE